MDATSPACQPQSHCHSYQRCERGRLRLNVHHTTDSLQGATLPCVVRYVVLAHPHPDRVLAQILAIIWKEEELQTGLELDEETDWRIAFVTKSLLLQVSWRSLSLDTPASANRNANFVCAACVRKRSERLICG